MTFSTTNDSLAKLRAIYTVISDIIDTLKKNETLLDKLVKDVEYSYKYGIIIISFNPNNTNIADEGVAKIIFLLNRIFDIHDDKAGDDSPWVKWSKAERSYAGIFYWNRVVKRPLSYRGVEETIDVFLFIEKATSKV